ncbi:hypothetical protein FA95DRAFT_1609929 [Auriscalpium vulgare]|uniref:Uncharacterized protein n=1 Tax=Auriscalpium vulgare TaxID=40419 RepID=A0ACB8RF90_9AGAM|nr:hypothetical protein FA95DRAFT_1609929 [Auriscalpium vulgare]
MEVRDDSVIELSSSEDEGGQAVYQKEVGTSSISANRRVRMDREQISATPSRPHNQNVPPVKRGRARRIVDSTSESSAGEEAPEPARRQRMPDVEIIELTDSSDSECPPARSIPLKTLPSCTATLPLFRDDDDDYNEQVNPAASSSQNSRADDIRITDTSLSVRVTLALRPSSSINEGESSIPSSPRTPKRARAPPKTPRTSKKAIALAAQTQRAEYAQDLFEELNRSVFGGGLPANTRLVWSNRLLTTAGRARWHRSKEGVHSTEIELATKILDCNERIRNTLSHEMCHLACWIINQDPKEGHGKAFKTRHDYEISYPYEWECGNCSKIYGRFSKSIRPDEVACGACKTGRLEPLFVVRQRAPKTPRSRSKVGSKLASGTPRDSPRPLLSPPPDADLDALVAIVRGLGIHD